MEQTTADRLEIALKRRRRSIRSLQKELHLAGVSGSSYANVHAYFGGKTQPPVEFLAAVGAALNVRPAWLAFEDGEMTLDEQVSADLTGFEERLDKPVSPEEHTARNLFFQVFAAVEALHVSGLAEDVLRDYCMFLIDQREDAPRNADAITSLLRRRFPLTVASSVFVDQASSNVTLFGEAAAAYAVDFLAQSHGKRGAHRLEELRWCGPPPAEPQAATPAKSESKKPRSKKGGS